MATHPATIGILSIGDMGLGIANLLKTHYYRVVTNASDRRHFSHPLTPIYPLIKSLVTTPKPAPAPPSSTSSLQTSLSSNNQTTSSPSSRPAMPCQPQPVSSPPSQAALAVNRKHPSTSSISTLFPPPPPRKSPLYSPPIPVFASWTAELSATPPSSPPPPP